MDPRTAMILLGKYGDICNVLPVARALAAEHGYKIPMIVSARFANVLHGASYVEIDMVHYQWPRVDLAQKYAEAKYDRVLCPQVWGKFYGAAFRPGGVPYNVAAWMACGFTVEQFRDTKAFPLIFDLRDAEREGSIVSRARKQSSKPIVIYHLGCGASSPFPSHYVVREAIGRRWGKDCICIDLCAIKAARLYDMLGLYDAASVLVTADTSALHLAAASKVPVVAYINDNDWRGSEPRCNVMLKMRYAECLKRVKELHRAISEAIHTSRTVVSNLEIAQPPVVGAEPSGLASLSS